MLYSRLVGFYERIGATKKGLEKTEILRELLKEIKEEPKSIYLIQGRFSPDYETKETGVSEQIIIKAIEKATGFTKKTILHEFKKTGDLGDVIETLSSQGKQQNLFATKLTTTNLLDSLSKISSREGKGAVDKKLDLVLELLSISNRQESKYIVRTILGNLKIGVGNGLIRDAIAEVSFCIDSPEDKKEKTGIVQAAYDKIADFAEVFEKSLKGEEELEKISLVPGRPIKVMLYPKAKSISNAFEIVGRPAAFEFKYDGFRMIITKDNLGKIKIFTRRLDEVTNQFPDVVKIISKNISADTFILDGEAIGYDPQTKKYRPFQEISQRIKRKYEIEKLVQELPIELNLFDILLYNGESLIEMPYLKRRETLENITNCVPNGLRLSEQIVTDSEEEAEEFYARALEENQEGLMAKGLEAKYKPGSRIGYGVKIKPDSREFDLVITGAEWGTGKRTGWLTSFSVSCIGEEGELLEVGMVSTGLKEKREEGLSFEEITELISPLIIEEEGKIVKISPKIVITVGYQDIQKSPKYSSGFALRFPRVINLRPDREIRDIASINDLESEVVD